MKLFSKSIETKKADPFAELQSAISDAINAALKNGVAPLAIERELKSHASDFERAEQARSDARKYGTPPTRIATESGIKVVDHYAAAAKSEERRAARQLRADRAEYQRGLAERAESEKWTR